MSTVIQILTQKGTLANVPPGRSIRIDPQLRAASARTTPADVGDPTFQTTDEPPLAPDFVTTSKGFNVLEIISDPDDALFGCFYIQNETDHTRNLAWEATYHFSVQKEQNTNIQPVQTDEGPLGETDGSFANPAIDPSTVQGENVILPSELVSGVTANGGYPNIEECNNKLNPILQQATDDQMAIHLPAPGADQRGMLLSVKNCTDIRATIHSNVANDGIENIDPVNMLDPALFLAQTLNVIWDNQANWWFFSTHYHYYVANMQPSV